MRSDSNVLNQESPSRIKTSPKGKTHEREVVMLNKPRHNSMPGNPEFEINDREDTSNTTSEIPLDEKLGRRNLKFFKPKSSALSSPRAENIDEVLKKNL